MTAHDPGISAAEQIAYLRLSTEAVEARDQLDLWREFTDSISDVHEVEPRQRGYRGCMEMYDLGALQLVAFQQDPVIFDRTNDHVKQSGIDHWLLSVTKRGGHLSGAGDRSMEARAGNVLILSLAAPFTGVMERSEFSCLFLGREEFADIADLLDRLSHQTFGGALAQILGEFMISLERHARMLTRPEVPALNDAFGKLLRAMLHGNADTIEAARLPIAATQFDRARRFINENLTAPNLGPDMICSNIGISRRQLYYLFERQGGVARYIKTRRLAACHRALIRLTEKKLIGSIAYEHGFTNLSLFYRQFQAQYGFTPGEARSAWLNGFKPSEIKARNFAEWMARVDET